MRRTALLMIIVFITAACQPAAEPLPTLRVLPSATLTPTITDTPIPTDTPEPTDTPVPSATFTPSNTPTETFTPSNTPTPSRTPIASDTPNATQAIIGTATAEIVERPILSTFTPLPAGPLSVARPTSTGTPEVVADVIITQAQFQEEVDRLLESASGVSRAELLLTETGVFVTLTARSENVFTTGFFLINFDLSESGFNNIVIVRPSSSDEISMQDGSEPTDDFITIAHGSVTEAVFQAFDDILNQRLGQGQHNLEFVTLADGEMRISLFVPEP